MAEKRAELCILDLDYMLEEENPVITIFGKTGEGKSVLVKDRSFLPYFYVEPKESLNKKEITDLRSRILSLEIDGRKPVKVEAVERSYLGRKRNMLKVYARVPADIPKLRDLLKEWKDVANEYEYSISFYRRYLIDRNLFPMTWIEVEGREFETEWNFDLSIEAESIRPLEREDFPPLRILSFDIETVEEDGEERIIMISIREKGFSRLLTYRKCGAKGSETLQGEGEMIERFVSLVRERDPDIILGYNTDRFDFERIHERANKHGIRLNLGRSLTPLRFRRRMRTASARIHGRCHIDLFNFISSIMEPSLSSEVLTLENVARELTGKSKRSMAWKDIERSWFSGDIEDLAKYCLNDAKLALDVASAVLPQIFELCRVVGQTPFDVSRMSYSQLVEWLLIRKAHSLGEVVPRRPPYDEIQKRRMYPPYTGGYVLEPVEGIHTGIALFDFRSLYPSIIVTHNISPETLDCMSCEECKGGHRKNMDPGGEHYYCANKPGIVPSMVRELIEERQEIKRRMKGLRRESERYRRLEVRQHVLKIMANASYGYYGYPGSRWYSRVCAQSAALWGRHYIRQVIDKAKAEGYTPIYGDTDSLFIKMKSSKEATVFLDKVNSALPGIIELDFQGFYRSGIFVSAKTGGGAKKRYALLDYRGNITIRGFERVRRDWSRIAKLTQERVLLAVLKDRSPEKAARIVREVIEKVRKHKVGIDDLVIYTQITRPLESYEQVGPHVVAARKLAERGVKVSAGSTIAYVIVKGSGSISSRAEPAEGAEDYDEEYYIRNQIVPAALRILSGLGYSESDFIEGEEGQSSLRGFLKGK